MTVTGPVPLSPSTHEGRFWRRFTSYDFARGLRTVPLVEAECEPVAAAMPILFAEGAQGAEPVALLRGVPGNGSAFVSPDGLWLATYVPSLLRVHPFSVRDADNGRLELMIDESSGLVTGDPLDESLFEPDGQPAEGVRQVIDFFRTREASRRATTKACRILAEAELLTPFAPTFEGVPADAWQGLQVIDRARFDALDDTQFVALRQLGVIKLAHSHFVSLAQLPWLLRAEALRDRRSSEPPAEPLLPRPDQNRQDSLMDFLSAMGSMQEGTRDAERTDPTPVSQRLAGGGKR